MRPPTESQIHGAVVAYCKLALRPGVVCHHSPNEAKRTRWEGAQIARLGVRAGWPDLEFMADGRAWFIELKAPRGRPTPAQATCHDELRAAGCPVEIARSVDEAIALLKRWGLTRAHAVAEARARAGMEART